MTRQDRSLWVVLVSQWRVSLCVTINLASYEVINVQRRRDRKKHMQMFLDDASDSDVSSTGGADLSEVPLSYCSSVASTFSNSWHHLSSGIRESCEEHGQKSTSIDLGSKSFSSMKRLFFGFGRKQFDSSVSWVQHQLCRKAQALHAIMWI